MFGVFGFFVVLAEDENAKDDNDECERIGLPGVRRTYEEVMPLAMTG